MDNDYVHNQFAASSSNSGYWMSGAQAVRNSKLDFSSYKSTWSPERLPAVMHNSEFSFRNSRGTGSTGQSGPSGTAGISSVTANNGLTTDNSGNIQWGGNLSSNSCVDTTTRGESSIQLSSYSGGTPTNVQATSYTDLSGLSNFSPSSRKPAKSSMGNEIKR